MPKEGLPHKQAEFVRLYITGPAGVRGNGAEAYRQAGYTATTPGTAHVQSSKLLSKAKVQREIERYHQEAERETIAQLEDWKKYAPQAQRMIRDIMMGYIPLDDNTEGQETLRLMRDRDDASVARVMLDAAEKIIERAYPSKVYAALMLQDPAQLLAQILGVPLDRLPQQDAGLHGYTSINEA